ncbi:ATP phosphoribosyltransferase [Candidatus Peregrinibacteria bacterium]|jgi:ATP phosphoribosyltransferase|nr:ATP phosphoribosyltransferase [Candidatus Peregrinibacteria bacterium]
MNKVNTRIRIAVQNKGRLMEPSLDYLRRCGLEFETEKRSLTAKCKNAEIELIFVRNKDITEYVKYDVADFGIVGQNVLMEKGQQFEVIRELGFGKCDLVVAIPNDSKVKSVSDLEHERIATSYPNTLREFLKKKKISASVIEIQGSVEICPSLGLADAVFDITQTGKTIEENNMKVLEKLASSEAVLIKNPNTKPQYEDMFL